MAAGRPSAHVRRAVGPILAFCSLLAAAGAEGSTINDALPQIYTLTPTGVNLQTGGFMRSSEDISIGHLKFIRSWGSVPSFSPNSSTGLDSQSFGLWNHNYGIGVSVGTRANGTATMARVYFDGRLIEFQKSSGLWYPWLVDAQGSELVQVNGNFMFKAIGDNLRYTRGPDGQMSGLMERSDSRQNIFRNGDYSIGLKRFDGLVDRLKKR